MHSVKLQVHINKLAINTSMKFSLLAIVVLIVFTNSTIAQELDLEKYKQAYIEQTKQILEKQIATMLEKQEDPEATLDFLASGLANCQVEILQYYPEKYQVATVQPVVDGKGLEQATVEVNELMRQDFEAGEITKEELQNMVYDSKNHFIKCSKLLEKELEPKN